MSKTYGLTAFSKLGKNAKVEKTNKVTIYLSYFKDDIKKANNLINKILKDNDVIICYRDYEEFPEVNFKETNLLIGQLHISILLITNNYLNSENNDSYNEEYRYILDNHIPFIPIIDDENIDLEKYTELFGTIQYLDINQKDETQISFDKKLKDFLNKHAVSSEDYKIASNAFKHFAFLSYRKKDRSLALELINSIHSYKNCQRIAIWYDEFLSAGEKFDNNLIKKISDSDAFILLVTPNLINENNYVKTTEYPLANDELHKPIIPVEVESTDEKELSNQYKEIPPVIKKKQAHEKVEKLDNETQSEDPKELYALGVAYLNGIGVEINRKLGVKFLQEAAEKDYVPALNKLVNVFESGNGVVKDYQVALNYLEKLIELYKHTFTYDCFDKNAMDYFDCIQRKEMIISQVKYNSEETIKRTIEIYKELHTFKSIDEKWEKGFAFYITRILFSISISGFRETREILDVDLYKKYLPIIKNFDSALYDLYYFGYVLGFEVFDKNNGKTNKELLDELLILIDKSFYGRPDEMCRILNMCFVPLVAAKRFSNDELIGFYKKLLPYFEYYKDEKERINKSAELLVELYDTEINHNLGNLGQLTDELIKVANVYERRSIDDPLLLGIYFRIYKYANLEKREMYFEKALKEAKELPESVFNTEPRIVRRDTIFIDSYKRDKNLSFEEKISKIYQLYESAVNRKNFEFAMQILSSDLIDLCLKQNDKKKLLRYCIEYKSLTKRTNYEDHGSFYYDCLLAYLNKDLSHLDEEFNKWINWFEAQNYTTFNKFDSINATIDGALMILTEEKSDFNNECAKKIFSLYHNYVSVKQEWQSDFDLIYKYYIALQIVSLMTKADIDEKYNRFAIHLYKDCLNKSNFSDFKNPQLLMANITLAIKSIVNSLNKNHNVNESLLKEYLSIFDIAFDNISKGQIPLDYIWKIGIISITGGVFLNENKLWLKVFDYLEAKVNAHAENAMFYIHIIKDLTWSNVDKAELLKKVLYFIKDTHESDFGVFTALYRGTYMSTINMILQNDVQLALAYHETIRNDFDFDNVYFRYLNKLNSFIYFEKILLGENAPELHINDDAFALMNASIITDCVDLIELYGLYAKKLNDKKDKLFAYELAAKSSVFILYQLDSGFGINTERMLDQLLLCLESASKIASMEEMIKLTQNVGRAFLFLDDRLAGNAPLWYMQKRVTFMVRFYELMLYKNNDEGVQSDFNHFMNLESNFDVANDYTDKFPEVIALLTQSYFDHEEDKTIDNIIKFGITYHLQHLHDYDMYPFWFMYCTFARVRDIDLLNFLTIVCDEQNVNKKELMIDTYKSLILELKNIPDLEASLGIAYKMVEYLDKYCKDDVNQALIRKGYYDVYVLMRDLYEKLGDDKQAYQYQELAKRYESS